MQDIQACTCTWQCFQIKLIVKANVHIYPPLLIIGLQTMVTSLTVVHVRAQRENSSASGGSEGMDQMVQHYLNQCLASSTKMTYEAGKRRYSKFCIEANHSPPILTSENSYVNSLHTRRGTAPSTRQSKYIWRQSETGK